MRATARTLAEFVDGLDAAAGGGLDAAAARAWRTALTALLVARHLDRPVDLARVLEMALVQALPGPPARSRDGLDPDNALHVFAVLLELETAGTSEARLVHALGSQPEPASSVFSDCFLREFADARSVAAASRAAG